MKKLFPFILLFSFVVNISGQDVEFSQFTQAPLLLNPGNAGMGRGYNEANLLYKSQYTTIPNAYTTMYASVDLPFFSHKMKRSSGAFIGAGLHFINNVSGDAKLKRLGGGLSISALVDIDKNNKISAGIQPSFLQHSITPGNIQWDSQFNGTTYDPTLPSNESFANNAISVFNLAGGLTFKHISQSRNLSGIDKGSFMMGYAFYNLLRPDIHFIAQPDRQYIRHNFYFKSLFAVKEMHYGFAPKAFFVLQGPHLDYQFGTDFLYFLKGDTKYTGFIKEAYVGGGIYYRNTDAIIPTLTVKTGDIILRVSYDIGIGNIGTVNKSVGGFEISLQFNDSNGILFNQGNKHVVNGGSKNSKM